MLAGLVGVAGSVALASVRLNLPLVVAGGLALALAVGVAIVMPETPRRRTESAESVEQIVEQGARERIAQLRV